MPPVAETMLFASVVFPAAGKPHIKWRMGVLAMLGNYVKRLCYDPLAPGVAGGCACPCWINFNSWAVGGRMTIRVRRLAARPSGVSLEVTIIYSPRPDAVIRKGET